MLRLVNEELNLLAALNELVNVLNHDVLGRLYFVLDGRDLVR